MRLESYASHGGTRHRFEQDAEAQGHFCRAVPLVLGLEETVQGALLGYFGERGHLSVGFEGGQHRDPATVQHHESAVWIFLVGCGALESTQLKDGARYFELLRGASRGHPGAVEPDDGLVMRPGFQNFDPVSEGQALACALQFTRRVELQPESWLGTSETHAEE